MSTLHVEVLGYLEAIGSHIIHCSKQLGEHFVCRVSHQCKDAEGGGGGQWRSWQDVGRRVKCRITPKQEWVSWAETGPVIHYWQYTLLNQRFPSAFGSNAFTVNIMRYLQLCEIALAVQLLQDGSSPSVIPRVWRRFWETGKYSRRAGQRCRRATTHQQNMYLVLSAR